MSKSFGKHGSAERGFSVVELLVVVSILAILSTVGGLLLGRYMGHGREEAYEAELQHIQTAVTALLKESTANQLDANYNDVSDMDLVTADSGSLLLSSYLNNLGDDGCVQTGCQYSISANGTVTQTTP